MVMTADQMNKIKTALDMVQYQESFTKDRGEPAPNHEIDGIVSKVIADLDFDPVYFLATGTTTADSSTKRPT